MLTVPSYIEIKKQMNKFSIPQSISWRPTIVGSHYAVSCGHSLAAMAAARVLDQGGNAVDAGVTMAMALAVLQPDIVSFAGVAPTLVYEKSQSKVISLAGLGYWPQATDITQLKEHGNGSIPIGIMRQIVPAAPATHMCALREFGTISFEEAATPALELARDGFAMYPELHDSLESHADTIALFQENKNIFLSEGRPPAVGSRFKQMNLGNTIARMIQAERLSTGNRDKKLSAVHDFFYRGEIARQIDKFHRSHGGFMRFEDLANFEVPIEDPISCNYHGLDVYTCDVWCQGIVLLLALKILEPINLAEMGHNSTAYIHTIASALNLAFGDREAWVGDPKFIDVPTRELLSIDHALKQMARIDPNYAFSSLVDALAINGRQAPLADQLLPAQGKTPLAPDTIYGCVVDRHGNAYSVTPSDTMYDIPMIDGLGLAISSRGMQGRLEPNHPCFVQPGKRPRLTPTPAIALRDGNFEMAWGTPGGDVQCASMLQVLLNISHFEMSLQQAIESPRVAPFNFPNSFAPNDYYPARLCVENRLPKSTIQSLLQLGYDIEYWNEREYYAGAVCAIRCDQATGMLHAGADPRRAAYALAW